MQSKYSVVVPIDFWTAQGALACSLIAFRFILN